MFRWVAANNLVTFIAGFHAKSILLNQTGKLADKLVDRMQAYTGAMRVDNLVNNLFKQALKPRFLYKADLDNMALFHNADLDNATLGKLVHPVMPYESHGFRLQPLLQKSQLGPSPLVHTSALKKSPLNSVSQDDSDPSYHSDLYIDSQWNLHYGNDPFDQGYDRGHKSQQSSSKSIGGQTNARANPMKMPMNSLVNNPTNSPGPVTSKSPSLQAPTQAPRTASPAYWRNDGEYEKWLKDNGLDDASLGIADKSAKAIDPEGLDITLPMAAALDGDNRFSLDAIGEGEDPVLLCWGFQLEEVAVIRSLIDDVGGLALRVVPCTDLSASCRVIQALSLPEPSWEEYTDSSNIENVPVGLRCLFFSAVPLGARESVIALLEYSKLPRFLTAVLSEADKDKTLGEMISGVIANRGF